MKLARIESRLVERPSKTARMLDEIVSSYEDVARKRARIKCIRRVHGKIASKRQFLRNEF